MLAKFEIDKFNGKNDFSLASEDGSFVDLVRNVKGFEE